MELSPNQEARDAITTPANYYPVVVFDLDGTLLRHTTVSLLLTEHLGHVETFSEFERSFAAGEISNRDIADASAASYEGRTTNEIRSVLATATWIDGMDETIRTLAQTGTHLLLATITWRLAAELLQERLGFAAVCGTELHVTDGVVGGEVSRYFDEHDKLSFVEDWCAKRSISLADVAAVGDSRSDVPLFRRVGRAVALNATADAQRVATKVIDTDDLREVLPLLTL
jgi:phosphoserine phosphatase